MAPDEPTAEDRIYGKAAAGRPFTGGYRPDEPEPEPEPDADEPVEIAETDEVEVDVEQEGQDEAPREFPAQHRDALTGLLLLGYLEDDFTWQGHRFVVHTLTTRQHIRVGVLVKPYLGTRVEGRAYQAAMVACGIVLVDGQPVYTPLSPKETEDEIARKTFEEVMDWFPPTITYVQAKIQELEIESREVLEAMGKATG